jgi:hypothetical protein
LAARDKEQESLQGGDTSSSLGATCFSNNDWHHQDLQMVVSGLQTELARKMRMWDEKRKRMEAQFKKDQDAMEELRGVAERALAARSQDQDTSVRLEMLIETCGACTEANVELLEQEKDEKAIWSSLKLESQTRRGKSHKREEVLLERVGDVDRKDLDLAKFLSQHHELSTELSGCDDESTTELCRVSAALGKFHSSLNLSSSVSSMATSVTTSPGVP